MAARFAPGATGSTTVSPCTSTTSAPASRAWSTMSPIRTGGTCVISHPGSTVISPYAPATASANRARLTMQNSRLDGSTWSLMTRPPQPCTWQRRASSPGTSTPSLKVVWVCRSNIAPSVLVAISVASQWERSRPL